MPYVFENAEYTQIFLINVEIANDFRFIKTNMEF